MIALFGRDEYAVLGIAAILDLEKIPYRRVPRIEREAGEVLVVVSADLSEEEVAYLSRTPAVVLNGGPAFALRVLGAPKAEVTDSACVIAVRPPAWPPSVTQVAQEQEARELRIPLAPLCEVEKVASGRVLATLIPSHTASASARPAVVQLHRCVWSAVDLGTAFAHLLTEAYRGAEPPSPPAAAWRAVAQRAAEGVYYAAPEPLRRWIQGRYYTRLERRLRRHPERNSAYPADATGWLLIELLKGLIQLAGGTLVRVERWPAPYTAAAALTHDIEPRQFAYTHGLDRLLRQLSAIGHRAAIGLVAEPSNRFLSDTAVSQLLDHDVICHGLEHRGENVHGRKQTLDRIRTAKERLEGRLRRTVDGYRSPRLDRSPDLAWALDRSDFTYDSSWPDVDRENPAHYGGGMRLNLPYRPLVTDENGRLRPSRCLELPLTAPDCIQPLFAGHSVAALRGAVEKKASFIHATGGLYVALVHAGVFGRRDVVLREAHLSFVCQQLRRSGVWLASPSDIAEWWRSREALRIVVEPGAICATNCGPRRLVGVRLAIDEPAGTTSLTVPPLDPGEEMRLAIPERLAQPAA